MKNISVTKPFYIVMVLLSLFAVCAGLLLLLAMLYVYILSDSSSLGVEFGWILIALATAGIYLPSIYLSTLLEMPHHVSYAKDGLLIEKGRKKEIVSFKDIKNVSHDDTKITLEFVKANTLGNKISFMPKIDFFLSDYQIFETLKNKVYKAHIGSESR